MVLTIKHEGQDFDSTVFKMQGLKQQQQDAQLSKVPRTPMEPRYIPLTFLIYFRMITFYLLPMLAECGRGSISFQSPVTYQVETDQCKRNFESVTPALPLFLLTSSR